jgi:hypothetical protein
MLEWLMQDGREKLARELADTEAMRAAEVLRVKLVGSEVDEAEIDRATDQEFRRVYDATLAEAMLGGS